jgi:aldehyde:ferredoxin oxidoreductase
MKGVYGRYLDVDLSSGAFADREIPAQWYELHLGGRGIAARLLLELVPPAASALGPENALVFASGPLQGTGMAGAGRHVVAAKSPKTGSISDSSAGGFFGHELGRSGYDGVIVRGHAPAPVYLLLYDGRAELACADELWGKASLEVDESLRQRHPGARVATIGPAGEKTVQMACIVHDGNRCAGRPGLGAVMGSQRLKAVVVKGSREKALESPSSFARERTAFAQSLAQDPNLESLGRFGTARGMLVNNALGILPTRNFREGIFSDVERISGEEMAVGILAKRDTCAGCPVRCKRVVQTSWAGRGVDPRYGGPEYETMAAFGSLCLCSDLSAIALVNQICNAEGIDTISCGVAIAALMEASERGLIRETIRWGDARDVVSWAERIARREGLGNEIANGLEQWARSIGADFAMTIKGVEVPLHDPRGKPGFGLSYASSPRGAAHMEGMHDPMLEVEAPTPELGVTSGIDRFQLAGKAPHAVLYENLRSFTNSLVMCAFTTNMTGPRYNYAPIRKLLESATGLALLPKDMLRIGERNMALLRLYSALVGYRRQDDRLPERFHEALPEGASAGRPIDREAFNRELKEYNKLRGYDDWGPTEGQLRDLGMPELAILRSRQAHTGCSSEQRRG